MQSINFDTGYKTYAVNGDENNVIRINVADINLRSKLETVMKNISSAKERLKNCEPTFELYEEVDKTIKEQLDYAFGENFSKSVFGDVNCLTVANSQGDMIIETFVAAFMPIVQKDIEEAMKAQKNKINILHNKKTDKYISDIKGIMK